MPRRMHSTLTRSDDVAREIGPYLRQHCLVLGREVLNECLGVVAGRRHAIRVRAVLVVARDEYPVHAGCGFDIYDAAAGILWHRVEEERLASTDRRVLKSPVPVDLLVHVQGVVGCRDSDSVVGWLWTKPARYFLDVAVGFLVRAGHREVFSL